MSFLPINREHWEYHEEDLGSTRSGSRIVKFDLNNDGQKDLAVLDSRESHYEINDTYYVFESSTVPEEPEDLGQDSDEKMYFYRQAASRIVPDIWGNWTSKIDPPSWNKSDRPDFEPRYMTLTAFRFEGTNYFSVHSVEDAKSHWRIILLTKPDYSVKVMCVFYTIKN